MLEVNQTRKIYGGYIRRAIFGKVKRFGRQKRSRMKPALTGCGGDDGSGGREGATEMRWRERKGVRAEEKS